MAPRKSPTASATAHAEGTQMVGNDGNAWIVRKTAAGVSRWSKAPAKAGRRARIWECHGVADRSAPAVALPGDIVTFSAEWREVDTFFVCPGGSLRMVLDDFEVVTVPLAISQLFADAKDAYQDITSEFCLVERLQLGPSDGWLRRHLPSDLLHDDWTYAIDVVQGFLIVNPTPFAERAVDAPQIGVRELESGDADEIGRLRADVEEDAGPSVMVRVRHEERSEAPRMFDGFDVAAATVRHTLDIRVAKAELADFRAWCLETGCEIMGP